MSDLAARGTVLVTGVGGAVGKAIVPWLQREGWRVRGIDLTAELAAACRPDESFAADITDASDMARAMAGVSAVIHLAAYPDPADLVDVLLQPNVVGLHRVLTAAAEAGASRVVLASTMQVVSGIKLAAGELVRVTDARPMNPYALTKVWAEAAGAMHARKHGASVIAVRIGWLPRTAPLHEDLGRRNGQVQYLSHDDAGRCFVALLRADLGDGEFRIINAVSVPPDGLTPRYDMAPSAALGFVPQDVYPGGSHYE